MCSADDLIKMKRKITDWEKIFANKLSTKRFNLEYIKNSQNQHLKDNSIRKLVWGWKYLLLPFFPSRFCGWCNN